MNESIRVMFKGYSDVLTLKQAKIKFLSVQIKASSEKAISIMLKIMHSAAKLVLSRNGLRKDSYSLKK